jgi:hypothetical protein
MKLRVLSSVAFMVCSAVATLAQTTASGDAASTVTVLDLTCLQKAVEEDYKTGPAHAPVSPVDNWTCPPGYVYMAVQQAASCYKPRIAQFKNAWFIAVQQDPKHQCQKTIMTAQAQSARFDQVVDAIERACNVSAKFTKSDPAECSARRPK